MKRKLISLALALILALSLLPDQAIAADNDFTIEDGVLVKYNGSGGNVTIPSGVTSIGVKAFYGTQVTNVTIPSGVTSIDTHAFGSCENLTNVNIPATVTSIGSKAFSWCKKLTSVTIPSSVTSIGMAAFDYCLGLTNISIPSSVTSIDAWAFRNTPWLVNQGDFAVVNGILLAYNGPGGDVTIPSDITSIGVHAFSDCDNLTSVIIPPGITSIEPQAFFERTSLVKVSIPSSVTSIGNNAFEGCRNLAEVAIPSNVTNIEAYAFSDCSSLSNVFIPSSVTDIMLGAFYECNSLTDVYYGGSKSQWDSISIEIRNDFLETATIHYNSTGPSTASNAVTTEEYIYNTSDINDGFTLPAKWLDDVTDTDSAVETVQNLVNTMTNEQKAAPISIDLATLYAETATAKAASRMLKGNDILIDASAITELGNIAFQTSAAVEAALESGGVTTARYLSNSVTLVTDETDITVRIDPDVLKTEVDKVRVETPDYALTFKLSDLASDLTQTLSFTAKSAVAGSTAPSPASAAVSTFSNNADNPSITKSILANAAVPAVEISMTGGKTTNSITVSLPSDSGDTTYQAVVSADGTATASKYNPATTQMDGKVNTSGKYTVMTNEKDFTDISTKSKEMQDAIRYLASKGIISGTTATTFNPDGSINRAEIATLLVKALGKLDTSATTSFSDVVKSNWYYSAAASSQKHGLINGFEDNTFRGATSINKVQIVAVSSRVLTSEMNYKAPSNPSAYLSKYKDTVANWAQSEVALATRENLVVYRTDGTFSGDKNMTRGDAAIIIYRLFQRIW